jgi:hypothetical protein
VLDVSGSRSIAWRIGRSSTFALCLRLPAFAALWSTERARKGQRPLRRSDVPELENQRNVGSLLKEVALCRPPGIATACFFFPPVGSSGSFNDHPKVPRTILRNPWCRRGRGLRSSRRSSSSPPSPYGLDTHSEAQARGPLLSNPRQHPDSDRPSPAIR